MSSSLRSERAGADSDHTEAGDIPTPGKRTRTERLTRRPADGEPRQPATAPPVRAEGSGLTSGQPFVDSIVHGPAPDPTTVATALIGGGARDENHLTNEVYWTLRPGERGAKLVAGSAGAVEWLRLRDDVVRPALRQVRSHEATPAVPELDPGQPDPHPAHDATGPAPASGDARLDALLASVPVAGSNRDQAAWLVAALATGLVGAKASAASQLAQLAAGETRLRTAEGEPGAEHLKRGLAKLAQKGGPGVERIQAGVYEVEPGDMPILGVMVTMVAARIRTWIRAGAKGRRALFTFGDLVRADAGYGGSQHTAGNAIDLGGISFSDDRDVIAVLSGLEAGKVSMVFPDFRNHVHLSLDGSGRYELGLPLWPGPFFQPGHELAKAKASRAKAAGDAAPGTTITAEGLIMWHAWWYTSTGTSLGGGTWKWVDKVAGKAGDHLASGPLKALLKKLDGGGSARKSSAVASEDGVVPPEAEGE